MTRTGIRKLIVGRRRPSVLISVVAAAVLAGASAGTAAVTLSASPRVAPEPPEPTATTSTAPPALPEVPEAEPADIVEARETGAVAPQGAKGPEGVDDIPLTALSAYQRAETIINTADSDCDLRWTLIAAVGRVLTDHGERGDRHRIRKSGRVTPALIGPTLRSRDGRRVADTDGGRLDDDRRHDRAVGPMLIDPPTWAVVGVDADGDGDRNPQDVDDAALALAVRLCADDRSLRRLDGRKAVLRRISTTRGFVDAVLEVAAAYRTSLRANVRPVVLPPVDVADLPELPPLTPGPDSGSRNARDGGSTGLVPDDQRGDGGPGAGEGPGGTPTPSDPPSETGSPTPTPTDPPSETPTEEPSETETPTAPPSETPTEEPSETGTPTNPPTDPSPTASPTGPSPTASSTP